MKALTVTKGTLAALGILAIASAAVAGGSRVRLEGRLSSDITLASGKAKFESRQGPSRQKFSVEIEDGQGNTDYDVTVAGTMVGTITTGVDGIGDLNFDSNFEPGVDDPATRFPDFPQVAPNTEVCAIGGGDEICGSLVDEDAN
jgi:hypothetical protein